MSSTSFDDLRGAVSDALTADLSGVGNAALVQLTRDLEVVRAQLDAVDVRVISELESRRVAGEFGRSSTRDLLVSELRLTPAEAKARVARAGDLGPRRSLLGEVLPPLLPATSAALAAGAISTDHVAVITRCTDELPCTVSLETLAVVESTLVEVAGVEHPGQLRRTASLLLARLDSDGDEPRDQQRRRGLTLTRHADGSGRLSGRLTVEATAVWDAILDALSAPVPSADGERDDRSANQRRHDALVEAGRRLLRSGSLPTTGGVPVTVLVRTTLAELRAGDGVAFTNRGDVWPLRTLAASLPDAELVAVLTEQSGAVLAFGRRRRLASTSQRLVLALRDGGCCFPGCDRPPGWTEAHHIVEWTDGGPTDLDNLCLLCTFHHREFGPRGWQVRITDGLPEWLPPPWLDPDRRPRRNTVHHVRELTFTCATATEAA